MKLTVATNLTDLHREPSFLTEMLTQMLHGEALDVLEEREKWSRVRNSQGYEGWAYRPYLSDAVTPSPTHIVSALNTPIHLEPSLAKPPISRLMAGTFLRVVDQNAGWAKIEPAGTMLPAGWVARDHLRALTDLPLPPQIARRDMIEYARRYTGIYYLWGGNTPFGTDCSGLTYMLHRLAGYAIPRDAHPQFHCEAAKPVEPPFRAGDLLFFRSDTNPDRIGHVGISTGDISPGGWHMIHSSRSRNGVYEEDVQANEGLKRTFAGARSFLRD